MHELVSYRHFGRVRSLRNDRTARTLGRYVAIERDGHSRPSGMDARSLCSDRAWLELGRYVATEQDGRSVATFLKPEKASILWLIVEFQKRLNRYFEGLCTFLLLMFGMIDNSGRFIDDAWTVIWLFPRSELDMRGDRFSTFGEFRSVCKIWMNNYGTIYRDRKNCLKLSSLDYPPSFNGNSDRNKRRFDRDLKDNTKLEVRASRSKRISRYVATDSLTGRYVASGSKPRSVLLVFVRFDEDSKDNPKEDLSEALQTGRYVASGSKPRSVLLVFVVNSQRKLRLRRNKKRRYVATDGLTGRYVASGSRPTRVLLVFVVKSQRKLRLGRNEKRFDEDSKENPKEDHSEALQVAMSLRSEWKQARKSRTCFRRRYVATDGLTGRYVASGSKPRRVLLVFVVKSQRKLRLRRNEKRGDEDSQENQKEDLSEALLRPSSVRARSLRSDRVVCVLGRYVATEQRVRARSLRSDRAVCACLVATRYVATELGNRFVVFPFSAINLGVFQRFLGEVVLSFQNINGKRVLKEKSGASFSALPVAEGRSKAFNFVEHRSSQCSESVFHISRQFRSSLQTVGTEIRTVDFRLNKETRKTLISQRSRISARANDM
ncbi:hypothetical protein IGI04_035937 [Brassica rapa subsp. trilocularis]|uniref:Uncharacterized protein n=1 Tax=Brassica rapa subsp. trilocularis TaxID=1813537 RepID=A0ABQ7LD08_BRACM|nr:hypothetical protein IGI04_035937 [Brassica rapa subsp. trilocularis]